MKKIGILYGTELSFPGAFIDRVNSKQVPDVVAEPILIDKVLHGTPDDYAVIIDRISQDVPFYRAFLKNAALCGTAVINNPFWSSADEKFFNNSLATKLGVPVPKTVLVPSRELPPYTMHESFRNLAYPMDWDHIFSYVGFPAYMNPLLGGSREHGYKLNNAAEFFEKHAETGQRVMMLQEEIEFDRYFRCYCIGGIHVRVMPYEPRSPHHLSYQEEAENDEDLILLIGDYVRRLTEFLGYDFNTVEFGVRKGVPYAIDCCNPVPETDPQTVGAAHFEWVVETAASYVIERALSLKEGRDNLTWGRFMERAVEKKTLGGGIRTVRVPAGNSLEPGTTNPVGRSREKWPPRKELLTRRMGLPEHPVKDRVEPRQYRVCKTRSL